MMEYANHAITLIITRFARREHFQNTQNLINKLAYDVSPMAITNSVRKCHPHVSSIELIR